MKKYSFKSKLTKEKSSLLWNYRINIPIDICKEIISQNSENNSKRVFCEINNSVKFQCALTSNGKGDFYIIVNKENRKKSKIDIDDTVNILLYKDDSIYGIELPIEMKMLLNQDEEGNILFHKLTPGKQRSLLHLVGKPKNEQIRIRKAIIILDYLKSVNGKLDFKELNEAFKANK